MRVYLGSKNVCLEPGEYTHAIEYRTSRQLGFFEDHDELYWNVTGNGWAFPIEAGQRQRALAATGHRKPTQGTWIYRAARLDPNRS